VPCTRPVTLRMGHHGQSGFCACFRLSFIHDTLVVLSHHWVSCGWVMGSRRTLAMAPNIYFYHNARSLEATWKYLLICSVGDCPGLVWARFFSGLRNFRRRASNRRSFSLISCRSGPASLSAPGWQAVLRLGPGRIRTKNGPGNRLHTWLPDAHRRRPPRFPFAFGALRPWPSLPPANLPPL